VTTTDHRIGIAVVEQDGQFLVGRRGDDVPLAGLWEFPGGKCRSDESPRECAVRECREETGLPVVAVELLHQTTHEYPHGTVELHFWRCRAEEADVHSVHSGYRWVPAAELPSLAFPAANAPVIAALSEPS